MQRPSDHNGTGCANAGVREVMRSHAIQWEEQEQGTSDVAAEAG